MSMRTAMLTVLALASSPLCAADTLTVEAMISPAWVEHAGSAREPLAPGMAVRNKDRIQTGAGSRVLLRMDEGSAIKLGENAMLAVDDLLEKKGVNARRLVSASLDVLRGAFRFTTEALARPGAARDVRIKVRSVTAGIRGTDVWGKSIETQDVVCLIEGSIDVRHGTRQFTMQEPLSFFIAPRTGEPKPVAPVPKKQLEEWVEETEIRAGKGAIIKGGDYAVEVAASDDQGAAQQSYDKVRAAGFPAEIETVGDGYGASGYRVRIPNLPGEKDAEAIAGKLKSLGFGDAKPAR